MVILEQLTPLDEDGGSLWTGYGRLKSSFARLLIGLLAKV